jgi:NAD(P)-dependent dehydrogenase (short-subunit alcohol dehydrogenase family)
MIQYTVFITGANRGLGLEFVRQYAADNWRVFASCRDLVHARELQQLAQYSDSITLLQLDITNFLQLRQIAEKYTDLSIDLLINNAAIYGDNDPAGEISLDPMKQAFLTNTLAPLKICEAFQENIAKSHLKTIVAISSKMGSISNNNSGGSYPYRTSKTALNMIMKNLSIDLKNKNIKVFILYPGWVKTEMGGQNATITPEHSVANMRLLLARLTERESGNFYDYLGNTIEW